MLNADVELSPTQIVTRDPVTGELEVSNLSDIIPEDCCVPTGGTAGQVLTVNPDGSFGWTTPSTGSAAAVWVSESTNPTLTGNTGTLPRFQWNTTTNEKWYVDTNGVALRIEALPDGGTDGQVLTVQPDGSYAWVTPTGGGTAAPIHERDVELATAGMLSHTLPHTPIGKVIVTRNGVDISDSWDFTGAVGTYDPALNYGCTLDLDDKLIFSYERAAV
jgi:hypothetical protein